VLFPFELPSVQAAVTVSVQGQASVPVQVAISPYAPPLLNPVVWGSLPIDQGLR
jgi:hypothetical protein